MTASGKARTDLTHALLVDALTHDDIRAFADRDCETREGLAVALVLVLIASHVAHVFADLEDLPPEVLIELGDVCVGSRRTLGGYPLDYTGDVGELINKAIQWMEIGANGLREFLPAG